MSLQGFDNWSSQFRRLLLDVGKKSNSICWPQVHDQMQIKQFIRFSNWTIFMWDFLDKEIISQMGAEGLETAGWIQRSF